MNKKAALEMSMTTIIMIVLSVVFLILALVVLRNMYGFQTQSIGSVQDQTLKQINNLYLGGEETGSRIQIQLGSDKTAKIRAGTDNFGIGVVAVTRSNAPVQNDSDLEFEVSLDESPLPNSCVKLNGLSLTKNMFGVALNKWFPSRGYFESTGWITITVNVPPTMRLCTQTVFVRVRDKTTDPNGEILGKSDFNVQILRKSPFG